jgi:hypothetical protein
MSIIFGPKVVFSDQVSTSVRNVFSTGRYLEHHGNVQIQSISTGHYCQLNFKESGYFSSSNNQVEGDVFDSSGRKMASIM